MIHGGDFRVMFDTERQRPEWPQETEVHIAERATALSDAHSSFHLTQAVMASARRTLTACSS